MRFRFFSRPRGRALALCAALAFGVAAQPGFAAELSQDDLNFSLIQAAGRGDMTSFNLALGLGANIHAMDRQGNNAVLLATEGQQSQMLRMLLEKGVDPDARGGSGFTPLTYAAMRGLSRDMRLLLKAGADPNKRNAAGDGPLHLAVAFGHSDLVPLLIAAGARIEERNAADETSLIVAIRSGNRQAFNSILALGALSNVHDKTGRSALFWAILENQEEMAVALIENGADFDMASEGYTPLQLARILKHAKALEALSKRGATN